VSSGVLGSGGIGNFLQLLRSHSGSFPRSEIGSWRAVQVAGWDASTRAESTVLVSTVIVHGLVLC